MEQKDYILREIEKIGILLKAILNNLFGKKENFATTLENQFEKTKELLINEINFDLDKFLYLNKSDSKDYLTKFKGINTENLELLGEIIFQFGINGQTDNKRLFFEKALQLYELCNAKDKTFSIERENRIKEIKSRKTEDGDQKQDSNYIVE